MKFKSTLKILVGVALFSLVANAVGDSPRGRCEPITSDFPFSDRVLCSNPQLSELDDMMMDLYWAALGTVENREEFEARHREWDSKKRRACETVACLISVYEEKIQELGGEAPSVKDFRISGVVGEPGACEAYLKLLNENPIEKIEPCRPPALANSGLSEYRFDQKMSIQQIEEFFRSRNKKLFKTEESMQKHWQLELSEIQAKSVIYSSDDIYIDDEVAEVRIVRVSRVSAFCQPLPESTVDANDQIQVFSEALKMMSLDEKRDYAKKYGYAHYYYLLDGLELDYIGDDLMLNFSGKPFLLDQKRASIIHAKNPDLIFSSLISLSEIISRKGDYSTKQVCKFWLNSINN